MDSSLKQQLNPFDDGVGNPAGPDMNAFNRGIKVEYMTRNSK